MTNIFLDHVLSMSCNDAVAKFRKIGELNYSYLYNQQG